MPYMEGCPPPPGTSRLLGRAFCRWAASPSRSPAGPSQDELDVVEVYDPRTRTWQAMPPMLMERTECASVVVNLPCRRPPARRPRAAAPCALDPPDEWREEEMLALQTETGAPPHMDRLHVLAGALLSSTRSPPWAKHERCLSSASSLDNRSFGLDNRSFAISVHSLDTPAFALPLHAHSTDELYAECALPPCRTGAASPGDRLEWGLDGAGDAPGTPSLASPSPSNGGLRRGLLDPRLSHGSPPGLCTPTLCSPMPDGAGAENGRRDSLLFGRGRLKSDASQASPPPQAPEEDRDTPSPPTAQPQGLPQPVYPPVPSFAPPEPQHLQPHYPKWDEVGQRGAEQGLQVSPRTKAWETWKSTVLRDPDQW